MHKIQNSLSKQTLPNVAGAAAGGAKIASLQQSGVNSLANHQVVVTGEPLAMTTFLPTITNYGDVASLLRKSPASDAIVHRVCEKCGDVVIDLETHINTRCGILLDIDKDK